MTVLPGPRLVVDLQTAQGGFFGNRGIRRYAIALTQALLRRRAVAAVLLNPNRRCSEPIPAEVIDAPELRWNTTPTLRMLDAEGASVYVMTSPFERARPVQSVLPPYLAASGMPIAAVLYDLIPEIIDVYTPDLMAGYRARRELLKQADLLLALSEHTRRDAIERLKVQPERVAVIGAGASDFFRRPVAGEDPKALLAERLPPITRPFVLCVSGWARHKNAEGLIDAWARLPSVVRDAHQLVVTCRLPPDAGSTWTKRARVLGLGRDDVLVTDYVDDDVLRSLYQQAKLFAFPSFYEGFGLPVLEAVRCGCPAVVSNASALPEVLDWEPATFPPDDVDAMAQILERGLCDASYRAELRTAGDAAARRHTWERVADRVIEACIPLDSRRRRRRSPPLRLALVGRFASPSGAATSTRQLIGCLDDGAQVDCFAVTPDHGDDSGVACLPVSALGRTTDPWSYDAVVYLATRDAAPELVEVASRYPGIVWFLDPTDECPASRDLSRIARACIVTDERARQPTVVEPPFGRSIPTWVVRAGDPEHAVDALLRVLHANA